MSNVENVTPTSNHAGKGNNKSTVKKCKTPISNACGGVGDNFSTVKRHGGAAYDASTVKRQKPLTETSCSYSSTTASSKRGKFDSHDSSLRSQKLLEVLEKVLVMSVDSFTNQHMRDCFPELSKSKGMELDDFCVDILQAIRRCVGVRKCVFVSLTLVIWRPFMQKYIHILLPYVALVMWPNVVTIRCRRNFRRSWRTTMCINNWIGLSTYIRPRYASVEIETIWMKYARTHRHMHAHHVLYLWWTQPVSFKTGLRRQPSSIKPEQILKQQVLETKKRHAQDLEAQVNRVWKWKFAELRVSCAFYFYLNHRSDPQEEPDFEVCCHCWACSDKENGGKNERAFSVFNTGQCN